MSASRSCAARRWRALHRVGVEAIMKTLVWLRLPFAVACAAVGGVGLLAAFVVLDERVPAGGGLASASAPPASPPQIDPDSSFCHGTSSAGGWMNARIRPAPSGP